KIRPPTGHGVPVRPAGGLVGGLLGHTETHLRIRARLRDHLVYSPAPPQNADTSVTRRPLAMVV
ncbi:MAG: hypothetical protein R6U98_05200, partial [Pirellulaceae bacterium]